MSDHQPASHYEPQADAAEAPREAPRQAAMDLHQPDFSRLRMARASLDGAFPER